MERSSDLLARAFMHDRIASTSAPGSFTQRHHQALARRRRIQADLARIAERAKAKSLAGVK